MWPDGRGSHSTVHRIWQAHALQPHRVTSSIHDGPEPRQDPRCGRPVPAAPRTPSWTRGREDPDPGLAGRSLCCRCGRACGAPDPRHQRNGLTSLYAALEVPVAKSWARAARSIRAPISWPSSSGCRRLSRAGVARDLDNSPPQTARGAGWLRQHPRVHFHFTPEGGLLG